MKTKLALCLLILGASIIFVAKTQNIAKTEVIPVDQTRLKPKIVTSITPIASIVAMITEDAAKIVAIDASSGCPHHYHMKPSDKEKVTEAQMMVYIDDHFDGFAGRLFENFEGSIVKISDIKSINLIGENGKINWHFWLDLNNILALQEEVSNVLLSEFPDLKQRILLKREESKEKIAMLARLKADALSSVSELVVLSDSLEHFFTGSDVKITKLYQKSNSSLNDFEKLQNTLNVESDLCIVLDSTQDPEMYKKFNKKIIQLESENWVLEDYMHGDSELFYSKYVNMINQLQSCNTNPSS